MISISNFDKGRFLTKLDHKKLSTIPGSADWIKAKEEAKRGILKKAEEIKPVEVSPSTPEKKKKKDYYRATKTVAIASALGVPGDAAFDVSNLLVDAYKQKEGLRGGFMNKLKTFIKSPEAKQAVKTFVRQQKGFALPASAAIATIPIAVAFKADSSRKKKDLIKQMAVPSNPTKVAFYKEGIEKIAKEKMDFKTLQKNRVPLTAEERSQVMGKKAVWHHGPNGEETPAVWKSVDKKTGKVTYVTNTHRATAYAPTVEGAISKYHKFIKGTA
jgi:hypothetical protein